VAVSSRTCQKPERRERRILNLASALAAVTWWVRYNESGLVENHTRGATMRAILTITFFAVLMIAAAMGAAPIISAAQSGACAPSGGLSFICGLQAPEDLVLVPGSRWLIASGMVAGSGLHLIDTQAKT